MLASVLQSAGYKTGLYTSPHLKSFTERIRINGKEIDEQFVIDFVNQINPQIQELKPSFFEITVAMAFQYFASEQVDIAVIEVGMGGRLDSTNVITPEVSLITNIGYDHAEFLGDTLELIAKEKAGIIKPGVPVIVSERQPALESVFNTIANEKGSPLFFGDVYRAAPGEGGYCIHRREEITFDSIPIPLTGHYQTKNIPGVLMTLEVLINKGFSISRDQLRQGLENVITQTNLKGRWQILKENPLVICDTGHNEDGIRSVVDQLAKTPHQTLHVVMGVVRDKAIDSILRLWPADAKYYFCEANIPRALEATVLQEKARMQGLAGMVIKDVNEALDFACKQADPEDLVFIGGSTFVVAEIENL